MKQALAAGLHIEESKQTVLRLEAGTPTRIRTSQLEELLSLYDASPEEREEALELFAEAKEAKGDPASGWWRGYSDLVNSNFDHFAALEQACQRMIAFQLTLLPGLLQTPEYRRWIVTAANPAMTAVDVERELELTARRQRRLTDDLGFVPEVFLSESVLRYRVGGPGVMREQLRHLDITKASIRVVPFDAEGHLGLVVQSFTLFELPALRDGRMTMPPVVFVEGFKSLLSLEDTSAIEYHRQAIRDLDRVALDQHSSRALVQQIAEEHSEPPRLFGRFFPCEGCGPCPSVIRSSSVSVR
ncbi:DUF5753 domain-containing protein [Nocardia sp. NBC_01499]|uniref:helix-turn-helix domain-containing protein n=1 Tax=Nocardia sp. NBC_01499 TaxID=2903597 RepID=UPI00386DC574